MNPRRLAVRLRLFWIAGVRHLTGHRIRVLLSAVGIAAGVALAVGVGAIASSIDASVHGISRAAASHADLEVRPPADVGLPPEILTEVRSTPGVTEAGATVESYTLVRRNGETVRSLVLGFDQAILNMAPRSVDPTTLAEGDPFGLYLSSPLAAQLGVEAGGVLEMASPTGWHEARIAGLLPERIDARIAVGPIEVVQGLLGREGRVDAVYLQADDPAAVAALLDARIGDRARVGTPGFRSSEVQQLVGSVTTALGGAALVALFVGAFLVYNTMAMAAAQRRKETGLLRALGAGRAQLFRYFCAEGALLGAVGAAAGVGLGVLLARAMLAGGGLEEIFPVDTTQLVLRPRDVLAAALIGVAAAVLASILPALRTARMDPITALRPTGSFEDSDSRPRLLLTAGGVLVAAGILVAATATHAAGIRTTWILGGFVLLLGGLTLLLRTLVPLAASLLARRAARPRSFLPHTVRFAAESVHRTPGRTTFTAGAIVLALSLVVGFAIAMSTFSSSVRVWMDEALTQDLHVHHAASGPLLGFDVRLDVALAERLEQLPEVSAVSHFRSVTGSIDERVVIFQAGHNPAEADRYPQLRNSPDAVIASRAALTAFGIDVGDTLELATPVGAETVRVVGLAADPDSLYPQFRFGIEGFERIWGDIGVDSFGVFLAPGVDPLEVKAEILERFGNELGVDVQTRAEFREANLGLLDSISNLLTSVTTVAVVIAGLGMANTLLISTLERRREIGVLRAVGMVRRQVVELVTAEAVIVAVVGIVLASIAGTGLGLLMREILRGESGMPMPMVFPPSAYLTAALLGVVAAVAAALAPAYRAARSDITQAIQYE